MHLCAKMAQGTVHRWKLSVHETPIWAVAWQNRQINKCAQQSLRSSWESAQSDHSLRCLHDEPWPGPLLPIERTAKTHIRLDACPGWSEVPSSSVKSTLSLKWMNTETLSFSSNNTPFDQIWHIVSLLPDISQKINWWNKYPRLGQSYIPKA